MVFVKILRADLRFNPTNSYYLVAQGLLSSRITSKNIKIKMHRNLILSVVYMGVKFGLAH
jgi:hypothetical protein